MPDPASESTAQHPRVEIVRVTEAETAEVATEEGA